MEIHGHICSLRVYAYKGIRFEYGAWGMVGLRKDDAERSRYGARWWATFAEWRGLPEDQREQYLEGGGCERF